VSIPLTDPKTETLLRRSFNGTLVHHAYSLACPLYDLIETIRNNYCEDSEKEFYDDMLDRVCQILNELQERRP
jgi:hypothetical protein